MLRRNHFLEYDTRREGKKLGRGYEEEARIIQMEGSCRSERT
jgi:hypothetical protein